MLINIRQKLPNEFLIDEIEFRKALLDAINTSVSRSLNKIPTPAINYLTNRNFFLSDEEKERVLDQAISELMKEMVIKQ